MKVTVPDSIRSMEPALAEFFDGMVHKLHVNSHKNALTLDNVPGLIDLMLKELTEFRDQMEQDRTDTNVLAETWDAANFWFLIYALLRQEGVATMRERFIEEYFDIQPDLGMVFCVKKRSGSKYGPGDEVKGTKNKAGEVFIRTQNAAGGFAVTLPRSHLIWWKATGSWPTSEVYRRDNDPANDKLENLFLVEDSGKDDDGGYFVKPPFVSQYKPSGKENTANYGKWVYQRRHMFQLVRVGYWDTAEEAARLGIMAWKAKVQEMQENKNV